MSFKKPFRASPVVLGEVYRRHERDVRRAATVRFGAILMMGMAATATFGWFAAGPSPVAAAGTEPAPGIEQSVHYSGCREARAAGVAPIYRGQPGYRPEMDGDGDGIACEPYR